MTADFFVPRDRTREPVVLLHGITGSAAMWRSVVPLLTPRHEVVVPTALGHCGGSTVSQRPVRVQHVVDDIQRLLDRMRLDRAHLAGNSLGGWIALELAGRGRALSVCALSPAGLWDERTQARSTRILRTLAAATRAGRPMLPILARSSRFRRWALRDNAVHGERVTRAEFLALADDMIACTAATDLLATTEALGRVTASCPITVAWSEHDRVFPMHVHAPVARDRIASARHLVLPGVGHVPMFDDPGLVAATIADHIVWCTTSSKCATGTPRLADFP